jgi:hypothetical protein
MFESRILMSSSNPDRRQIIAQDVETLRGYLSEVNTGETDGHPAIAFSSALLTRLPELDGLRRALLDSGSAEAARTALHGMLLDVVLAGLQSTSGELPGPQRQVAEFLVGAVVSLCTWWLREAPELPPEAIDEVYRALASGGLIG